MSEVINDIGLKRIIGEWGGDQSGPVIIFFAGVHGNEHAAIEALEQIFETITQQHIPIKGKIVAIAGNLTAISKSVRYIDEDLNRIWTKGRLAALKNSPSYGVDDTIEKSEQREIYNLLHQYIHNTEDQIYIIDLHTTSSISKPFVIIGDTVRNRRFAMNFHVPILLGLEERVDGTIIGYTSDMGHITIALESGQHDDRNSVLNHISATWVILTNAGCVSASQVPGFQKHIRRLQQVSKHLSKIYEVRYRKGVSEEDHFRMEPGFQNFRPIRKGELIARDRNGDIYSHLDGNIFMPLYQQLGSDGFFIIRPVNAFWLKISEWLRRLHVDKALPLFPGIYKSPHRKNELVAYHKIARWFVVEIFHLLGYRKKRVRGQHIIFTKRKYDLKGPNEKL